MNCFIFNSIFNSIKCYIKGWVVKQIISSVLVKRVQLFIFIAIFLNHERYRLMVLPANPTNPANSTLLIIFDLKYRPSIINDVIYYYHRVFNKIKIYKNICFSPSSSQLIRIKTLPVLCHPYKYSFYSRFIRNSYL